MEKNRHTFEPNGKEAVLAVNVNLQNIKDPHRNCVVKTSGAISN